MAQSRLAINAAVGDREFRKPVKSNSIASFINAVCLRNEDSKRVVNVFDFFLGTVKTRV